METDEFVVNNLDDQIAAFQETAATMRKLTEAVGPEECNEAEEASAVLRRFCAISLSGVPGRSTCQRMNSTRSAGSSSRPAPAAVSCCPHAA